MAGERHRTGGHAPHHDFAIGEYDVGDGDLLHVRVDAGDPGAYLAGGADHRTTAETNGAAAARTDEVERRAAAVSPATTRTLSRLTPS